MKGQFVRRHGIKTPRPGRIVRTGRTVGASQSRRQERKSRPLRLRRKPRASR